VFRALRVERHEVRHSNFLAWLINPRESHQQGTMFLRLFLDAVVQCVGEEHAVAATLRASDATEGAVEVQREAERLDLRIVLPTIKVVIGIENKVFAAEQTGQLGRYAESVQRAFGDWRSLLLYLTLDGDLPSDDRWLPLTHQHVLEMVTKGIGQLSTETPQGVRSFIEHYAELLRDIYDRRPASPPARRHLAEEIEPSPPSDRIFQGNLPGLDKFEAALRMLVKVPKAEVEKRIAEEKAARMERRRQRQTKSGR
jgi:hypothetical protein